MRMEEEEIRLLRATVTEQRRQLRRLSRELDKKDEEIGVLKEKLIIATDQVLEMRSSPSWKITRPLRLIRMMRR
ncbi:hypothetical protein [Arcanobacterium sp. S3PF19]|uniref:hypothetical protein n=1 Tax=Arcanobacterium sp. S3PF19 TaxID=1219585 RepID=UPI0012EC6C51|nr:hypothetical protein [Arcanobacterium sp. S3PF19]